jgi:glycosyltransferase involved in cell wall biosynthesis
MKILYLASHELWFQHLPAAHAAREAGAEVILMAPFQHYGTRAEANGYRIIPWRMSRRSLNPLRELRAFFEVLRVYQREKPDLVHHLALKAIIYGGTAAQRCGQVPSVNSIAGLGRVFTISSPGMLFLRRVLCRLLAFLFRRPRCVVTFENQDDLKQFVEEGIVTRESTHFIPGVGLETERFSPRPEPPGSPVVMLPSRMLWEKGIDTFVEASRQLKQQGFTARFVLVGAPDLESRGCIPEQQLKAWADSGLVEWWGANEDMATTLSRAHIICLPTYYREGLPRVLMEAGACARAVIATDTPGCRYIVQHGENGLLIPPKDAMALGTAIRTIIENPELRARMGEAGRERAIREFSEAKIQNEIFDLYRDLLSGKWPPRPAKGRDRSSRTDFWYQAREANTSD